MRSVESKYRLYRLKLITTKLPHKVVSEGFFVPNLIFLKCSEALYRSMPQGLGNNFTTFILTGDKSKCEEISETSLNINVFSVGKYLPVKLFKF